MLNKQCVLSKIAEKEGSVAYFGSGTAEDRHDYEKYIIQNLKQNNCSNIVVTRNSMFRDNVSRHCENVTFDYIINFDTYNPLDYLYQLYKKGDKISYFINLDNVIKESITSYSNDPFHLKMDETLLLLLICYVIENEDIQNKNFESVITLLQQVTPNDSAASCSEEIASGNSPLLNKLRLFYENNPKKWGEDFWKVFNIFPCNPKTLADSIICLLIQLQRYMQHSCTTSIDFDELIKEKKNILIELPAYTDSQLISLYKLFFLQFFYSRYAYGDLCMSKADNCNAYSDAIHTQIYFDCEDWGELIKPLTTVLATGKKYRIGLSLYCADLPLMERKYDIEITDLFTFCDLKLFLTRVINDELASFIQKETGVENIQRLIEENEQIAVIDDHILIAVL